MRTLLPRVDRATRTFWRLAGRRVDLAGDEHWLRAPVHSEQRVADGWPSAAAALYGGSVSEDVPGAGLLPDLRRLDGPGFESAGLHPDVRDFYEHTSQWRMEVQVHWNRAFRPAGAAVSRLFGRRVQQLAIPAGLSPTTQDLDSRVAVISGPEGDQRAAAWVRTLRTTGEHVYSGCYAVRHLPGAPGPSVHVTFPLEAGNVQVFLRPTNDDDGGLHLTSLDGPFGANGAYVVVADDRGAHAARVPIREDFHVYVDGHGVLRTDHRLMLWSARVVHLHYRLDPLQRRP